MLLCAKKAPACTGTARRGLATTASGTDGLARDPSNDVEKKDLLLGEMYVISNTVNIPYSRMREARSHGQLVCRLPLIQKRSPRQRTRHYNYP